MKNSDTRTLLVTGQMVALLMAIALLASGCSVLGSLFGTTRAKGPKTTKAPDASAYKTMTHYKDNAQKAAPPTDLASFKAYDKAWAYAHSFASSYFSAHCRPQSKKPGTHCKESTALQSEAANKRIAGWETALASPAIGFAHVQDKMLEGQRDKTYGPLVNAKIDAWVSKLAEQKKAYWTREIKESGSLKKWANEEGKSLCVISHKSSKRSPASIKHIDYIFNSRENAYVRCWFPGNIKNFRRNENDYWKVSIRWAGRWENMNIVPDVKRLPNGQTIEFKLPTRLINKSIKKKMENRGWKYNAKWLRVQVAYKTRYISGRAWRGGVFKDIWKHQTRGSGTFFLKR